MKQIRHAYALALSILLSNSATIAADNATDAEAFYTQGIAALNNAQQVSVDPASSMDELTNALNAFELNIRIASRLGHPAATLYQAQILIKKSSSDPVKEQQNRRQGCASLDDLARKGVVAAAVLNFRECDMAYMRFESDSPEHRRVLETLEQSLGDVDPAATYYPFPLSASQCFASDPVHVTPLTQEQFRAEAKYILGSTQEPSSLEALQRNLDWLEEAARDGCAALLDMRPLLREQLIKLASKEKDAS
ncbi:hypothetical protein NNO07_06275 [Pseudomonas resinovorans]|uniref:Secreted protein n=1 Tax=Metapseudomonas resinovorans TaxID=53412 RepID=A0ABT4Y1F5_METRE|nr:hypothetical protein [Pseudomonas resinovorans]MDA8482669.1 hypothetical protein [Pseudomonas resinovorans]